MVCFWSLSAHQGLLALCFKVEKLAIIIVTPHLFFWRTRSSFSPVTPIYFLYPNDYITKTLISIIYSVFTVSTLTIQSAITQEDRPSRAYHLCRLGACSFLVTVKENTQVGKHAVYVNFLSLKDLISKLQKGKALSELLL